MATTVPGVLIPKPCWKDATPKMILIIPKSQKPTEIKFRTLSWDLRHELAYQLSVFCCSVRKPEGWKSRVNAIWICIKSIHILELKKKKQTKTNTNNHRQFILNCKRPHSSLDDLLWPPQFHRPLCSPSYSKTTDRTGCPCGGDKPASTTGQTVSPIIKHCWKPIRSCHNVTLKTKAWLFSDCGTSVPSRVLVLKDTERCSEGLVAAEPGIWLC